MKVITLKLFIYSNKNKEQLPSVKAIKSEVLPKKIQLNKNSPIKKIIELMSDDKITTLEAKKIYDSSKGNFDIIKKVYEDKRKERRRNCRVNDKPCKTWCI